MKNGNGKRRWTIVLKDNLGNSSYVYKYDGSNQVHLVSGSETPLALSNIAGNAAAVLRLELERSASEHDAKDALKKYAPYVKVVEAI